MADAREASSVLLPNSVDAVITSPPYPNEKDYTRTTRLESVLLGYFEDMGDYRALHLTGREKFVIKQKGFNVFPGEVEAFVAQLDGVDMVEVVGIEHEVFDEGIVAFVREKPGADLTAEQVLAHCEGIASYKRPQHIVIWPAGQEFPLTRVAKVDKLALKAAAEPIITQLRAKGGWDAVGQI